MMLASGGSELEWSRALMIGWLIIALGLSVLELWLERRYTRGNASIPRYE